MMKQEMQDAINGQINAELYSSYLYLSMAAWFESEGLKGFSHWMKVQATEEMLHVTKFFDYVTSRGGKVVLTTIAAPPTTWKSPLEAFRATLEHEVEVTGRVNTLMDLSLKTSDHATANFLQWFVAEQVEEEASVEDILAKLKMVDRTEGGMFLLDQEMAKRALNLPPGGFQL